jgi:hypothetical protein
MDADCQARVAASGGKFARAALKIGQRCAMRAAHAGLACRIGSTDGSGNRATDAALARAASRLTIRVGNACAGSDLAPFARRSPDPNGPPLTTAELVACLRATHLDRVGAMIAVEFPVAAADVAAGNPDQCTAPQTCQCRCASPSGAFVIEADADGR